MRPANIVTSIADVLAGIAIVGCAASGTLNTAGLVQVILLCLSTAALYGGGVVFNDVFDASLDRIERPERPIPSGLITVNEATVLATALLVTGIGLALICNPISFMLAIMIAIAAVVYDKWGKHNNFLGPLNMGLCRGLNLLLGMSIFPLLIQEYWYLSFIPVIYIASVTMISRGEVYGSNKTTLYIGGFLYSFVIAFILWFGMQKGNFAATLAFILFFAWMIFEPLLKAIKDPVGPNIGKSVKAGVLGLILMNAAWAAASGGLYIALVIVLLLPISMKLAKMFAVT
jgi:4-hydroxybenzoate polyprenyltransferase